MAEISPEYLERLEGPNGQTGTLLKRLPYDRAHTIEATVELEPTLARKKDIILREMLWEYQVDDYLTGARGANIDDADPALIAEWREKAVELYVEWKKQAFPTAKKGSSRTDRRRTPTTSKASTSDDAP